MRGLKPSDGQDGVLRKGSAVERLAAGLKIL